MYILEDDIYYDVDASMTVSVSPLPTGYTFAANAAKKFTISDNDDTGITSLALSADPPSFSVASFGSDRGSDSGNRCGAGRGDGDRGIHCVLRFCGCFSYYGRYKPGPDETITGTAKEATATLNLSGNTGEGVVTVTASADDYFSDTIEIPVLLRDAGDVEGFRVTLVPADGAWIGHGEEKSQGPGDSRQ